MLKPSDLKNTARKSGFNYVGDNRQSAGGKAFQADVYGGKRDKAGRKWKGPRRATAEEAAQDYCDYINGGHAVPVARLNSAGHSAPARQKLDDGLNQLERDTLAKLQAKQRKGIDAVRNDDKGYVYLIGEVSSPNNTRSSFLNGKFISPFAVKIGYSDESPERRIKQLQTGNPRKLVLLGSIRGTLADEATLHQRFISRNVLQEWFKPSGELLAIFRKKEAA